MIKKLATGLVALAVVLFAAGASGQPSDPAIQELYKAAKAEGKVIWQYIGSLNDVQGVADAFRAKYPEIKLEVFSYSSARVPTRIIGEAAGGKFTLDVASVLTSRLIPLMERDLVVKYDWTKIGVPKSDILLDGYCVLMFENPNVWVRNTNLVSEAEQPKTWEDILDPKWKGFKMSIRSSATSFTPLFQTWKKDKQKAVDFFNRLKKQDVVPGDRMAQVLNRISTGECSIGRVATAYALEALREKAPIALCPISPTADMGSPAFVPKGVPHPNAAKFFMAWLTSPAAEKEWAKAGLGRVYPPETSLIGRLLANHGIKYERITSREDMAEFEGPFSQMVVKIMGFQPE